MSLYNAYNNENIISRAVIAGMLNVLNNTITYNQVWSNDDVETVNVPWFYNQAGDERFMQDFYTHYASCDFPKMIDGNFDITPRGMITYTGSSVDAARITNRFVKGRYVKEINGQLESYVSFLYSIPLTVKFDCEVWPDNHITALKIEQAVRELFYKTVTFYVYYKGMRLGCTSGFSEESTIDKLIKYSFEPDKRIKLTFTIEVETYQPVFDPTTEMNANNSIKGFGYRVYQDGQKNDGEITVTSPAVDASIGLTVPKGQQMMIEWTYKKEGAIISNVDAYWTLAGDSAWNLIEKGIPNHEFWFWNIPETFTQYKQPTIIWEETDAVKVYRKPIISIIPDTSSKTIDASSFYITDRGYFMCGSEDASVCVVLEMKDAANRVSYTADNYIYFNITDYMLNATNPVWVNPSTGIFPGNIDFKTIDIYIANSVNNNVFGKVQNIKIV